MQGPEAKDGKLGRRSSGGGGRDREGTAFLPPPASHQAAGTHMFWCMRQPSAPTQPPPHRLRHTDTLPSRPPARLLHRHTVTLLPAPLQAGALALSVG